MWPLLMIGLLFVFLCVGFIKVNNHENLDIFTQNHVKEEEVLNHKLIQTK